MKDNLLLLLFSLILVARPAHAQHFSFEKVSIRCDAADSILARLLAEDIERVTGYKPVINKQIKGNLILITRNDSLQGQWERYTLQVKKNVLVIAGSDPRGTAYGVFDLSERIGVSPWYWWADVPVVKQTKLALDIPYYISPVPSVQYRGIFLNDEDWGLQPWAAKTFEPETGDIGPKTYAKIFELLLRLKANMIWPAMHPSTKPFYLIPGNVEMAKAYNIVIGSSHAEPMARSNTGEWDKKTMGDFNYIINQERVDKYWSARIRQIRGNDVIITIGMRGVHDSGIEGVKGAAETVPLLERIFANQRKMLGHVPQAFTAYKEVLDVYNAGLKVPEDVTLIWPDDNYGYIQRLSNSAEQQRSGGAGVYYHASYLGRPHDYLWLPSTHPALIREEMTKAYLHGSRKIWIINVGDIKPIEYDMDCFLDMAHDVGPFLDSRYSKKHLQQWVAQNISVANKDTIASLLWKYYDLAFERRPEFMGWSQTEPTTPTYPTAYNQTFYGDQVQKRLDAYADLENAAKAFKNSYQLVYYPIRCANLINQKFLYHDKALLYGQQGRLSTSYYDSLSQATYQSIKDATAEYNKGKWAYMMHMAPNKRPVFAPLKPVPLNNITQSWGVSATPDFIDVYLCTPQVLDYEITPVEDWVHVSSTKGQLTPAANEQRIQISSEREGHIVVTAGGISQQVTISNKDYISIHARNYHTISKGWQLMDGLGLPGASLMSTQKDSVVSYHFNTKATHDAKVTIYTLPTFPINDQYEARYAISVDDGPVQEVNIHTYGRSEEWKQAVLSNNIARAVNIPALSAGPHTLTIHAIDPGIILDHITIDLGGLQPFYGLIPEKL